MKWEGGFPQGRPPLVHEPDNRAATATGVERDYRVAERAAMVAVGLSRHLGGDVKSPLLGDRTLDVYLNDVAYWSNIPLRVWDYTIGGYQVIKKWLSYREEKLLGRPLTKDEVRYVPEMARRIAAQGGSNHDAITLGYKGSLRRKVWHFAPLPSQSPTRFVIR